MSETLYNIVFCSTSLATYDRRMQRITHALSDDQHKVRWISRHHASSNESDKAVNSVFIKCLFHSGILFYLEFNFRLFLKLVGSSEACISCVDLDTLLASTLAAKLKGKKLIFDAHEIFYEVPELTGKPLKKWIWKQVARWCIPHTTLCYTVNNSLKAHYEKHYNKEFHVIRNVPDGTGLADVDTSVRENNKILVYLGAVNKGRGIDVAIEAMQALTDYTLIVIGDGDEHTEMQQLSRSLGVAHRIEFKGYTKPNEIFPILKECSIGLNILVAESENYRLSLANKFFDYMHAGLPSINMKYPEYESILTEHQVGLMIEKYRVEDLIKAVKKLENGVLFTRLAENCNIYKEAYTWSREKLNLVSLYEL